MTRDLLTALLVNAAVFSMLLLLMLPLRALLKKRGSAVLQYALWAVVIIKLLLPFGFESSLSPFGMFGAADTPAVSAGTSDASDVLATLSGEAIHPMESTGGQKTGVLADQIAAQPEAATVQAAAGPLAGLGWADWALIAWVAGVLAAGGAMTGAALRLRRRVRRDMAAPSVRVLRILEECKKEIGLRCNVRVATQSALNVPVIAGLLRPVLLLPEDAETRSDVQLRHICLHELTHVRHGDLFAIALLNVLCALYWFNPLTWLCTSLIRRDMEAACDARVLHRIGRDARQEYISTVLHFAGHEKKQRLQAAMGMADGRMTMEKRVRSMFRRTHTGRRTKALALCVAVLMLAMSGLTACQPTPGQPVVVGKDQDAMLSAAAQSALQTSLAEQLGAPQSYAVSINAADGKLTVIANGVPLDIPTVGGIPILRVTAANFTQAQVDAMLGAFFGGQTLYEVNYGAETKDEIMQRILLLKQWKATDEYSSEADQQMLDAEIAALEAAYETAPETSDDTVVVSDGQLKLKEITDNGEHVAYYTGISVTTNYEDYSEAATFSVTNNNDMTESVFYTNTDAEGNVTGGGGRQMRRMAMLSYSNPGDTYDSNFGQNPPVRVYEDTVINDPNVLGKLSLTPAQAKALVEQKLAEAGIDNMMVVAMYLEDDENLGNVDGLISPAKHYAYKLYLCRTVGGIPVSYISGSSGGASAMEDAIDEAIKNGGSMDDVDFAAVGEWYYETINVTVDDSGILSLDWFSPLEVGETLVDSATLLPFADIAAKFGQQMQITYEPSAKEDRFTSITFTVERVALEYQRIAEQGSFESGLLVPVWNFYGSCSAITADGEDVGPNMLSGDGVYAFPLVSINAVDGSIINIRQGY